MLLKEKRNILSTRNKTEAPPSILESQTSERDSMLAKFDFKETPKTFRAKKSIDTERRIANRTKNRMGLNYGDMVKNVLDGRSDTPFLSKM